MAYETVTRTYEVRWRVYIDVASGTELPPVSHSVLGEYETQGDAERALAEAGYTRSTWGDWRMGYFFGRPRRIEVEIKESQNGKI